MKTFLSRHAHNTLLPERRCTAHNRDGSRCGNPPIPGGLTCRFHGGATPLAQKAAKERLLMLVEPALAVLERATRSAPPCEHCGRSDADRDPTAVRAAGMILDRAGFHPSMLTAQQSPASAPAYLRWVPEDRLQQINVWLREARLSMEAGEPRPVGQLPVLEAETQPAEAVDDGAVDSIKDGDRE